MEQTKQTVKLGYGKCVLKAQTGSFAPMRVKAPFLKESAVTTGSRIPGNHIATAISRFPQINGYMHTDSVSHPNGTIIMLQASKARGAHRIADGCIILRLRENAANIQIIGKLPTGEENVIGDNFEIFRGRADILSADEVAVHQIVIPRPYLNAYFEQEEIDMLFDVYEIDKAIAPAPQVQLVSTPTGLVTQEVIAPPARRMKFRKQ